jgi:hypothetical protein
VGLDNDGREKLIVLIMSKAKMYKGTVSFCVNQGMLVSDSVA